MPRLMLGDRVQLRMYKSALVVTAIWTAIAGVRASEPIPPTLAEPIQVEGHALAIPTPAQAAWQDLEVGMFVHLAPQTWQDTEVDTMQTPLLAMNPEKLDTDQWVRVAEAMRAKYIVFVAKHEGGFCWWQTDSTDFGVKNTPWRGGKGDVLADLSKSCAARGMKLGVYLSPQDKKHGVTIGGKASDPVKQGEYERLFRQQLTEVLSRYGEMVEVWFDGSLVFDVGDILRLHAPNAVVFQGPQATIRWVGNEEGIAPDPAWNSVKEKVEGKKWGDFTAADGNPSGTRWLPNECDARIRATWFWKTNNESTLKSVAQLMDMYERSVGHGGVLLLNNTPDRSGQIPEGDAKRSKEFGDAIEKRYGLAITDTSGVGREFVLQPSSPVTIDRVVLMEDLTRGERVRHYSLEAQIDGVWKPLAEGTAIGHKKIDRVPATMVQAVRLKIGESVGVPQIRRFAIYAVW